MTALCPGGGTSGPRNGVLTGIVFDATQVGAFVTAAGYPELDAPIAVIAAGLALTVDVFCGTDPPADPGITDADIREVNNPATPASWATAAGRIKDWFLHNYWFQVCECHGGITPAPPQPVLPTGTGNSTGLPKGNLTQPCWDVIQHLTVAAAPSGSQITGTVANILPSPVAGQFNLNLGIGITTVPYYTIPSGVNNLSVATTISSLPPSGLGQDFQIGFLNASAAFLGYSGVIGYTSPSDPLSKTATVTIPANSIYWFAFCNNNGDVNPHDWQVEFEFFCTGGPNQLTVACCPPDPLVNQYLQVILNIVSNLYTAPAGAPSTSWTAGTAHTGISGTGSFNIAKGVTAIRAQFTTIPSAIRATPGTPTFYWDLGFVTPLAMTYPLRSLRTVFSTQDMPLPIQSDAVAYTFPEGVVVTLIELLPA